MDRRQAGVRVRGKSIQVDFRYMGERCRETLRLSPTPANIAYAHRLRQSILYAIETGKFDYREFFPNSKTRVLRYRTGTTTKVRALLETYLKVQERRVEYSTWRDYYSAIHHHLIPQFGESRVAEVKPSDIRAWVASLGVSNKRINNLLIPLRGAFQTAVEDGLIASNPVAPIRNLRHDARDPHPFTIEEMHTLLDACEGGIRNLFQFAFWSGLRTSELIALQWFDIDLRRSLAVIRRASVRKRLKKPKTKAGAREVKLLDPALAALEAQKVISFRQGGAVFINPRTGKAWETDAQIRKTAWTPALKRAGLPYRTAYQTRHTYASLMLSAGENPMWVAQQMGHRDWGMIRKVYGKWISEVDPIAGQRGAALWSQPGHKGKASA